MLFFTVKFTRDWKKVGNSKLEVGNYNLKNGNSKLTLKIPTFTFEVLKLKFKTTIKVENFNF